MVYTTPWAKKTIKRKQISFCQIFEDGNWINLDKRW